MMCTPTADDSGGRSSAHSRRIALALTTPIDVMDWDTAVGRILYWAKRRESRTVCLCNVHSLVTAAKDLQFLATLRSADMVAPDGAPVAWLIRRLGHQSQRRISGPDLMLRVCELAAASNLSVFLLGGLPTTLERLRATLNTRLPQLAIAGTCAPPFRELTVGEEQALVQAINASGAALLFVGLGCPKQEQWMSKHQANLRAVMIGVGAAFDFHAGTVKRAPVWMQERGFEWLHRLLQEPKRLWRRYLYTNTVFLWLATRQLWRERAARIPPT